MYSKLVAGLVYIYKYINKYIYMISHAMNLGQTKRRVSQIQQPYIQPLVLKKLDL